MMLIWCLERSRWSKNAVPRDITESNRFSNIWVHGVLYAFVLGSDPMSPRQSQKPLFLKISPKRKQNISRKFLNRSKKPFKIKVKTWISRSHFHHTNPNTPHKQKTRSEITHTRFLSARYPLYTAPQCKIRSRRHVS